MIKNDLFRKICTAIVFCFVFPPVLSAQEVAPADNKKSEETKAEGTPDETDEIVAHIKALSNIVADNVDDPDTLIELVTSYLSENRKNMRSASQRFEKKLQTMSPSGAEAYRNILKRKMDKAMEDFLSNMLNFYKRHPNDAKRLDAQLKMDI